MEKCAGWCLHDSDPVDYRTRMDQAVLILQGKSEELTESLRQEMEQAAEDLRFERAAELRDRIRAIEGLQTRQRVIATVYNDTDAVGFRRGAKSCFTVLHFSGGDLADKEVEMLEEPLEDDSEAVANLVRQYYTVTGAVPPKTILLPCEVEGLEALEELISESAGRKVSLEVPKRGERLRLVESAQLNAQEEIFRRTTQEQRRSKTLEWLQRALELDDIPRRIEAFDISNLGNMGIVAAMTVFQDGKPLKNAYRKFRMRDQDLQDDYASMFQAVTRRFQRYLDGDEKFAPLPDLLLIDGGEVHTQTAVRALTELGLSVPCFGMVKDDRHRTRALVTADGREIGISGNQAVFSLIGNIQEETHNSAIRYQRSLRKEGLRSLLDEIDGIGPSRRNALLQHFHSVRAIREADLEALSAVVPRNAARAVYETLHRKDDQTCVSSQEQPAEDS
jgi:excinuclease ABC subunit C